MVGKLERQTYVGLPDVGPGYVSLDAIYEWDVAVREVVIGDAVPSRMTLMVGSHTELVPWAARRVVLFIDVGPEGRPKVIGRGVLDRHLGRRAWRGAVVAIARDKGITQCGGGG